ncbi:MAG: DHH family phosphoesterase [Candidatus Saccharimonadales bacterium]
MNQQLIKQLDNILLDSKHVVLLQPDNPDLDSLAAAVVMKLGLDSINVASTLVCVKELRGANKEIFGKYFTDEFPEHYDTVAIADTPDDKLIRTSLKVQGDSLKKKKFIVIDHHPEMAGAFNFADLKIIDDKAPAAAEIVYKIAKELGWQLDKEAARYVLLAYMYDSRKFTIDKVRPETFKIAAELLEYGINIADINYEYDQAFAIDPETYKAKNKLATRTKYYLDNQVAIYTTSKRLRKWLKTRGSISEYIKYELLSVKGVKLSIGITDVGHNLFTVTMRAHIPVARKIAEEVGGGGHDLAAGGRLEARSAKDARDKLVSIADKYIKEYYESTETT